MSTWGERGEELGWLRCLLSNNGLVPFELKKNKKSRREKRCCHNYDARVYFGGTKKAAGKAPPHPLRGPRGRSESKRHDDASITVRGDRTKELSKRGGRKGGEYAGKK